jgi:hypothetical protein
VGDRVLASGEVAADVDSERLVPDFEVDIDRVGVPREVLWRKVRGIVVTIATLPSRRRLGGAVNV